MKLTPKHMVSYQGKFYPAGKAFDISDADAEEMQKYGDLDRPLEQEENQPPRRARKKE